MASAFAPRQQINRPQSRGVFGPSILAAAAGRPSAVRMPINGVKRSRAFGDLRNKPQTKAAEINSSRKPSWKLSYKGTSAVDPELAMKRHTAFLLASDITRGGPIPAAAASAGIRRLVPAAVHNAIRLSPTPVRHRSLRYGTTCASSYAASTASTASIDFRDAAHTTADSIATTAAAVATSFAARAAARAAALSSLGSTASAASFLAPSSLSSSSSSSVLTQTTSPAAASSSSSANTTNTTRNTTVASIASSSSSSCSPTAITGPAVPSVSYKRYAAEDESDSDDDGQEEEEEKEEDDEVSTPSVTLFVVPTPSMSWAMSSMCCLEAIDDEDNEGRNR